MHQLNPVCGEVPALASCLHCPLVVCLCMFVPLESVQASSGCWWIGLEAWELGALLFFGWHFQYVLYRGDAHLACMPVEFVAHWLPLEDDTWSRGLACNSFASLPPGEAKLPQAFSPFCNLSGSFSFFTALELRLSVRSGRKSEILRTHLCVSECFGSRKQQPRQLERLLSLCERLAVLMHVLLQHEHVSLHGMFWHVLAHCFGMVGPVVSA